MVHIIKSKRLCLSLMLILFLFAVISCSKSDSDDAPVAVSDNVLDAESLTFRLDIIEDDPLEITIESSKEYIATLETVSEVTGAYELPAKTWCLWEC
ncbi:MAG: hypothetical protein ACOX3E_04045 [Desulfomonilia bacterium]|jgi:hypothetical protein|uniref:Uncharacterized protein n=1 Tax=anaerobic digester metagenome TaxID=1263854 RepID=A0A485M8H3_9ZZZZ|nr:hypothetical protein [Deltaproteobacteria bacterium]HRS57307.1 hypothetical protein [Desulfomonilia bacterium]HRV36810.1 hypothetical protein [Desulfomonilia bacterium]